MTEGRAAARSGIVRWGILGPGGIAARFMRHAQEAVNARVVAVGSRDRDRAAAFAARFAIGFGPRLFGFKPVHPGDQLIIEIEMGRSRAKIAKAKGVCKVAGEVVSEAEVMFSVV